MSAKLAPLMSSAKQDWQTPEHVLEIVRQIGPIGLDVATSPDNPCRAERFFTEADDGLAQPWNVDDGQVIWMNPPYDDLKTWSKRWRDSAVLSGNQRHCLALTPARTDTRWFQTMLGGSAAVCFAIGRLTFKGAPTCAPFPSAIFYAGPRPGLFEDVFGKLGWVVRP